MTAIYIPNNEYESCRYNATAIILHWLMAILIIGLVVLGYYMVDLPRETPARAFYFNLHKSLGILAALLVIFRIVWRWTHPAPDLPKSVPTWQRIAAKWSHRLLYVCLVLQPATGYISSSFGRFGVYFFGIELPQWGWEDKALREFFIEIHHAIALVLITLIVIHILGALEHLLIKRDRIFQRMLP